MTPRSTFALLMLQFVLAAAVAPAEASEPEPARAAPVSDAGVPVDPASGATDPPPTVEPTDTEPGPGSGEAVAVDVSPGPLAPVPSRPVTGPTPGWVEPPRAPATPSPDETAIRLPRGPVREPMDGGGRTSPITTDPSAGEVTTAGRRLPTLGALFATRERPLFVPGRRGPAPVVPAPEPPPVVEAEPVAAPPPLTLQLRGVVAGPGIELAIFIDPASGETRRLTVGEEHEGWKLNALDRRRATFRRGEEETVLEILAPGLATSPITPPPPAEETASRRPTRDGRPKPPAPIGAP